jgi:hypothetical protein
MATVTTRTKAPRPTTTLWPNANSYRDLLEIAADAADIRPPLYIRSLFGPMGSWIRPPRQYSEFRIIDPWRPLQTLKYLRDATIPARPWGPPDWARRLMPDLVTELFWRPSRFFRQSDEYGSPCSFPDEHWFFINGVATNEALARLNAAFLAQLFHRPITVMQNATDSLLVDLVECGLGKGLTLDRETMTEPAWRAASAILEALNAPATRRVVVIAHSQGTIIMANVLRAIAETLQAQDLLLTRRHMAGWHDYTTALMGGRKQADKALRDDLAHGLSVFAAGTPSAVLEKLDKLEIYTFANCADTMKYVARRGGKAYPYLEHFANEFDIVARLGILSPNDRIDIDGPAFVQEGAWGHLLNEHHLFAIDDYLYPGPEAVPGGNPYRPAGGRRRAEPRLYGYFHGKRPT